MFLTSVARLPTGMWEQPTKYDRLVIGRQGVLFPMLFSLLPSQPSFGDWNILSLI